MTKQEKKEEEFMKPYGEEWKQEMKKYSKAELINIIKKISIENIEHQFAIQNLKRLERRNMESIEKVFAKIPKLSGSKNSPNH